VIVRGCLLQENAKLIAATQGSDVLKQSPKHVSKVAGNLPATPVQSIS
jgi:hypothetical protein